MNNTLISMGECCPTTHTRTYNKNDDFLNFTKSHYEEMLLAIERANNVLAMSPSINSTDFRFHISHIICHALEAETNGRLRPLYGVEYDMLFDNSIKISVKALTDAFQVQKRRGCGLTRPKKLIMKNFLGKSSGSDDKDKISDMWLLTVNRPKKYNKIGFGIIHSDNFSDNLYPEGDQLLCELENNEYAFLCDKEIGIQQTLNVGDLFLTNITKLYESMYNYGNKI